MSLTIDLQPDIERGLLAKAQAQGVSLADFAQQVLARAAEAELPASGSGASPAKNLVELFAASPFKGLNIDFERDKDHGREIEL